VLNSVRFRLEFVRGLIKHDEKSRGFERVGDPISRRDLRDERF
jgi:hypothetical protein